MLELDYTRSSETNIWSYYGTIKLIPIDNQLTTKCEYYNQYSPLQMNCIQIIYKLPMLQSYSKCACSI